MFPVNNYQLFHQPNSGQVFVFVGTQIMTYPKISSDFRGIELGFLMCSGDIGREFDLKCIDLTLDCCPFIIWNSARDLLDCGQSFSVQIN